MKTFTVLSCVLFAGCISAFAQSTSSSASYILLHAPAGDLGGGGRVANAGAAVTADISVGDPVSGAVSAVTAGGVRNKSNLIGQLYDVAVFTIAVAPTAVTEGSTSQLSGQAALDDATTLVPLATQVAWSVAFGPVASLTASGLVTTAPALGPTSAQLDGTFLGVTDPDGTLLNVIDTGESDTFEEYAGDQIDDGWQITYFGLPPNATAAATTDADGDGRNNRFEYLSGFVPTDAASSFQFTITGFSSPGVMDFRLNKVIPGRTYTVKANTDLVTAPTTVGAPFSVGSQQTNRFFQDPTATGGKKFYFLEISKP